MARPRTFDEDQAVDAAMRAFWANGYEATTTEDLCAATGLGRSSIYNTFTSKHDLFMRALVRYVESMNAVQLGLLADERRTPMERIRALLTAIVDGELTHRRDGRSLGCLTVNDRRAGRAGSGGGPPARARSGAAAGRPPGVIASGQRVGDIGSARGPEVLARFLHGVIAGIRVAGQGGADRAALESIAATALDALTP